MLRASLPGRRVYVIPNGAPTNWPHCMCPASLPRMQPASQAGNGAVRSRHSSRDYLICRANLVSGFAAAAVDASQFQPAPPQPCTADGSPPQRVTIVALSRLAYRKARKSSYICRRLARLALLSPAVASLFAALSWRDGHRQSHLVKIDAVKLLLESSSQGVDLLNVVIPAFCRRYDHVDFVIGMSHCFQQLTSFESRELTMSLSVIDAR